MSYGPGSALGSVMDSVTDGIFPWDRGSWKSAGQMTDYAMQGAAAGAAVLITLIIIAISFVVSVFIRRAVGKDTTVARILWWTLGIFLFSCILLTYLLTFAPAYQAPGWYLFAWAFGALFIITTGCEIYSMRFDHGDIPAEELEKYLDLGSFTSSPTPSPNGRKTPVGSRA